jgi:hypothetical protein
MARIYELPTHLEVEDVLVAGLTARQLLRLAVAATLAYAAWDQTAWLPIVARTLLAALCVVGGLLLALLQPGRRPLEAWLFAGLSYALASRRLTWQRAETSGEVVAEQSAGWAEFAPAPAWIAAPDPAVGLDSGRPR